MSRIKNTREIIEHAAPVDIIGRRVHLRRSGRDYMGKCPFHAGGQERSPSLHVDPEKGWYCHGPCKRGGSTLDFLIEYENLEFAEAVELLASESGTQLQYEENAQKDSDQGPRRNDLYAAVQAAAEYYANTLANNEDARAYADQRGLTEDVRQRWQIGYATGDQVQDVADPDVLYQAGILKKNKKGAYYDPLAGRLIIPLHDTTGRAVAFTGRALPTNKSSAKYLNTGDTKLYKKSNHLFAYHAAVRKIRNYSDGEKPSPVVVEGQLNAIACHEQGIPAVAPGGSTLTDRQALLLQRLHETTRLAYDQDTAGVAATTRAATELRRVGQIVRVATLDIPPDFPDDETPDTDELAAAGHQLSYQDTDLITWAVHTLLTEQPQTAAWASQISRQIMPFIAEHSDPVVRDAEIQHLAALTGLTAEALRQDAEKLEKQITDQAAKTPQHSQRPQIDTTMTKARSLCAICLQMELRANDPNHWQFYLRPLDLPPDLLKMLSTIGRVRTVAAAQGIPVTTAIHRLDQHNALTHTAHLRYWAVVELPGPPDITGLCRVQDRVCKEEYQRRLKNKEIL